MTPRHLPRVLRRTALMAQVLHDLDLDLAADSLRLHGTPRVRVSWSDVREAIGDAEPASELAAERLARWVLVRRWVSDRTIPWLRDNVRPVGLPRGHALHPGAGWAELKVAGDTLDLGLGVVGLDATDPDRVVPVPGSVWRAARIDTSEWWTGAGVLLTRMATLAIARWSNDPQGVLRPMGDCDVLTLLGSRAYRSALAGSDAGMRAAAVPMRTRGWTRLSYLDPAFAPAAAAATDPTERGFPRPILITAEELVMVPDGGRAAVITLHERPEHGAWARDVRYR